MRRGILASRDELHSLRRRVGRKAFVGMYEALRRRCALILESAPMTEARWRTLWAQGHWGSALQAARAVQGRVLDLLIAHHIDPNTAYRDRSIEELKGLASWSTWVDPCHNHVPADLCTAEAAVAVVVGLDWLWEDLSAADRERLLAAISAKAIGPYMQGVKQGAFWSNCYHHWNAVVNGGIALAALALADEDGRARKAYDAARGNLGRFFAALGRDGGWDEGTGYWGYGMRYVLLLAEAARRLEDDQTLLHSRGMDATGVFPIYFTPNGQPASFGDFASVPLLGTFYLLAEHFGRREMTWWLDTYAFHRDVSTMGWSAAGLAMLFRPPRARTPRKLDLKCVKVFPGIGWAALADRWPRPTFYVAAKTGDLSANHSQRDMNSIQLQVDGEMLLMHLGHAPYSREYLSSARGEFYEVQACAHNTVVVAEADHQIDAHGRVVDSRNTPDFRYVACDAEGACGENTRFVRHVVMVVDRASQTGRMLLVLDDLTNGVPERVETFWHTPGRIDLDARALKGTIVGRSAALHFALASTEKAAAFASSYPVNHRRRDNVLRLSAGVVGRALTASVFSRRKISGRVAISEDLLGGVRVSAGRVEVEFAQPGRDLKVRSVNVR
jgi:hypothetical protein